VTGIRLFRAITWGLIAVCAGVLIAFSGWLPGTAPTIQAGTGEARIGGPFELTSHRGQPVSNTTLAGKPYLVFFGFTHCPDICPTTLYELTDLMAELGPAADRMTPLFITVDPERDTPEVLADYMTVFDARILALRGDLPTTDAAVKAFAAYYRKVPTEGGYTMDHTAGVILMDADGRFAGMVDMHEPRASVIAKLRRLVDG
jgi:protein SCO1/2